MCGINGIFNYRFNQQIESSSIRKMCDRIIHRGPDDEGFYSEEHIHLGMRRLSIIDLSTGHQPVSNEDRSIWTVFNGEIYNFQELRDNLLKQGHVFQTQSDTETLVHLYEQHGIDMLSRLRGMFAFAIWDKKKKELFIARDRLGIKPLNYSIVKDTIYFSSEIKALLCIPEISREINSTAIDYYLALNYVPAPQTMFKNIFKLSPGHFIHCTQKEIKIQQYWDFDISSHKNHKSEDQYLDELRNLFDETIRLHLISDVPLGVFLSGGIDSSAILASFRKATNQTIKTFSAIFPDMSGYNEQPYAYIMAKKYQTEHTEIPIQPDMFENLPQLIWHMDDPITDAAILPLYQLCNQARKSIKVILAGDGGDELFGGYERYQWDMFGEKWVQFPKPLRKIFHAMVQSTSTIGQKLPNKNVRYGSEKLERFIRAMQLPKDLRYLVWITICSKDKRNKLYTDDFRQKIGTTNNSPESYMSGIYMKMNNEELLRQLCYMDSKTYLPYDLLEKGDRITMSCSLEGRVPFVDHKLAEFAFQIPTQSKIQGRRTKYLLRKAFEGELPYNILWRPKHGFSIPISHWLSHELYNVTQKVLLSKKAIQRNYFHSDIIKDMLEKHQQGIENHSSQLWSLLTLELWHQIFIDNPHTNRPSFSLTEIGS